MKPSNKKAPSANWGPSESAFHLPGRPWEGKRKGRGFQHDAYALPDLQSLAFEMAIFRALLGKPHRRYYYSRHLTLFKQRVTGAERVARAALREGHSRDAVESMLVDTLAAIKAPGFLFTVGDARWVVENESRKAGFEVATSS